jgi:hypothetical protein
MGSVKHRMRSGDIGRCHDTVWVECTWEECPFPAVAGTGAFEFGAKHP